MQIISIINTFLVSVIISILLFGVILNLKYTEKSIYRTYLVAMFSFWAAAFAFVFVKFFVEDDTVVSYTREVASMELLLLGIFCLYSLISYPVVILDAVLLDLKNWWRVCFPMALALALYFVIHWIGGVNPFYAYHSFGEMLSGGNLIFGGARLALVGVFFFLAMRYMFTIGSVVPIYNKYIQDNIANSECNVDWVLTFVRLAMVVSVTYFIMLLFGSPYVNFIYEVSLIALFWYIVEITLFRKTSEHTLPIKLEKDKTSHKWKVIDEPHLRSRSKVAFNTICSAATAIDEWMERDELYLDVDFTTVDILKVFPSLTSNDLSKIFKSRGETFQSYVRRHRIIKACEIIINSNDKVYPNQIFNQIGFIHYSSFSRSFTTLVDQTPFNFINMTKEQQIAILESLRGILPPPPRR